MPVILNDILARSARRLALAQEYMEAREASICDTEGVTSSEKRKKELRKEYLNSCWLVDRDIQFLAAVISVAAEQQGLTKEDHDRVIDSWFKQVTGRTKAELRPVPAQSKNGQQTIFDEGMS